MPPPIIPSQLGQVQLFCSREIYLNGPSTSEWTLQQPTVPTVAEKINAWVNQSRAQILSVSAPSIAVYREGVDADDPLKEREVRFTAVSVVYLPAAEGHHDNAKQPLPVLATPGEGGLE